MPTQPLLNMGIGAASLKTRILAGEENFAAFMMLPPRSVNCNRSLSLE